MQSWDTAVLCDMSRSLLIKCDVIRERDCPARGVGNKTLTRGRRRPFQACVKGGWSRPGAPPFSRFLREGGDFDLFSCITPSRRTCLLVWGRAHSPVQPSEARRLNPHPQTCESRQTPVGGASPTRPTLKAGGAALFRPALKPNTLRPGFSPRGVPAVHYLAAMPPTAHDPNHLLTQLEAAKNTPTHSTQIQKLLTQLSKLPLDPHQLIRLHESLLFLRAFPESPSLIPRVENLLNTFHDRIEKVKAAKADMSVFDDFY